MGEGFNWAWAKFQANLAPLLTFFGVAVVAFLAIVVPLMFIMTAIFITTTARGGPGAVSQMMFALITTGVATIIMWTLASHVVRFTSDIANGKTLEIGDVFQFKFTGNHVVYAVIIAVISTAVSVVTAPVPILGTLAQLVFGVAIGVVAFAGLFAMHEQDLAPFDALKAGLDSVMKNPLLFFVAYLMSFAGAIACGVGVIVSLPFAALLYVYAYRKTTGGQLAP